jgi:hypothetical protein
MTSSRHACRERDGRGALAADGRDTLGATRGAASPRPQWLGDLRRYLSPNLNSIVVVSFRVIR